MHHANLIELQVKDYLRILARQKFFVIAILATVVGAAVMFTNSQTRYYTASVDVMIELESRSDAITGGSAGRLDNDRLLENEVGFLESRLVTDTVADTTGVAPEVKISASKSRDFITIAARSTDPETSVLVADTYAATYLELRREAMIDDLFDTSSIVQAQVDDLDQQLAQMDVDLEAEITALAPRIDSGGLDSLTRAQARAQRQEAEQRYEQNRQPLLSQRLVFAQYLTTTQLNADLTSGSVGRIVSPAETPLKPSSPNPTRNIALGFVLGMVLAATAAMLRHSLRDVVSQTDDASAHPAGLALLASVPNFGLGRREGLITLTEPDSVSAESFRSLRTAVLFSAMTSDQKVLQITSANMSEGKSETAANLAVALAQAEKAVVIVDADLRRPKIAERFDLTGGHVGLSNVATKTATIDDALQIVDAVPGLSVLTAGPMPPDPAAFVASESVASLFEELREMFDFVIIDSPPVGLVSDPLTLSRHADGVIAVARNQKTKHTAFHDTIERLRQVDANLMGFVLNGTRRTRAYKQRYYVDPGRASFEPTIADVPRLRSDSAQQKRTKQLSVANPDDAGLGLPEH